MGWSRLTLFLTGCPSDGVKQIVTELAEWMCLGPLSGEQAFGRSGGGAVGEDRRFEMTLVDTQVVAQQPLQHGAQIRCRLQIAVVVEIG